MQLYITLSAQILLDQSFLMGVHVLWESQVEYHICHNDWEEVSKLLDLVPASILSHGSLQVSLDSVQPASNVMYNRGSSHYGKYLCSLEELDAVCMDIPNVKIFRFPVNLMCSVWLRLLMEEKLAKKFIFFKEYWEGTAEIVPLLARSGFISNGYRTSFEDDNIKSSSELKFKLSGGDGTSHVDTVQAMHKLVVHHCAQYNLPNLLDLYLDHHKLVLDNDSLGSLLEAAVSFYKSCECYCSLFWIFFNSFLTIHTITKYILDHNFFNHCNLWAVYGCLCFMVQLIVCMLLVAFLLSFTFIV